MSSYISLTYRSIYIFFDSTKNANAANSGSWFKKKNTKENIIDGKVIRLGPQRKVILQKRGYNFFFLFLRLPTNFRSFTSSCQMIFLKVYNYNGYKS